MKIKQRLFLASLESTYKTEFSTQICCIKAGRKVRFLENLQSISEIRTVILTQQLKIFLPTG